MQADESLSIARFAISCRPSFLASSGPRSPSCSRTRSMNCTRASTRLRSIFALARCSGRLSRRMTYRVETSGSKTPGSSRSFSTWSQGRILMRQWSQVLRQHTRRSKIVRLCTQAYAQGGVLSLADVALLLHKSMTPLSQDILEYERATGETVPRRGTVHDMGRSVTHKAIICYKRLVERKPTSQVAEETFHSADEVEYYVQCFRRVQLCRDSGMVKEDIARATGHSLPLVQEYLDLIDQFKVPPLPNSSRKEGF